MGQQTSKIAYDVMIQSIENGGLKLVDFESKVKSLKLGFIKRLLQNKTGKWRHMAAKFYKTNDLKYYFKCNRIPSNIGKNSMKKHSIIGANFNKSESQR